MKYYILKNASNANGWDMFPAGEAINYTLNSETLSVPQDIEIDSLVIGYRSAPKDKFYSLYKVKGKSGSTLILEKELEVNGGASIAEVRDEVRELIESDYSGIFEIKIEDFERICKSMLIHASTDFVRNPSVCRNQFMATQTEISFSNYYRPYITAIKSKPFLLLAGISGTGKSRIVRELARACWVPDSEEFKAQKPSNYEMVQVKPNWHDSSELIGYVSRIEGEKFIAGDFLRFIAKAWENLDIPYFLCLDEMNLAPVEQYFAEYLSVIETRKADGNGNVTTDPILKSDEQWFFDLTASLPCGEEVRQRFNNEGITIPKNLIVIGTVNMDETTFSFSRKVLDRAMTIEMNEVNLDGGLSFKYEVIGKLGKDDLIGVAVEGVDVYEQNKDVCDQVISYLQKVNDELEGTPFKVAYRTRNEFLLYVINNLPYSKLDDGTELTQDQVIARALDEITSMKILSRIEGDESKVKKTLLEGLKKKIKAQLESISEKDVFAAKAEGETTEDGKTIRQSISLAKLDEMIGRLDSGYTSFWA